MSITENGLQLIVYTGTYTRAPENVDEDICSILGAAHRNNPEMGVTGVMFFQHGRFLQFLEGSESLLNSLLKKIERDPRHDAIQFLFRKMAVHGTASWSPLIPVDHAEGCRSEDKSDPVFRTVSGRIPWVGRHIR